MKRVVSFYKTRRLSLNIKALHNKMSNNLRNVFSDIYETGLWVDNVPGVPKSGPGSLLQNTHGVRDAIDEFCVKNQVNSIVDVGCGDLSWLPSTRAFKTCKYTGIDIVSSIILQNSEKFPSNEFLCMDAVNETVPAGDLVIIRDVLFHLHHVDCMKLLERIRNRFKYYLITSCNNCVNNDELNHNYFHELNIFAEPFNFTSPILTIEEPLFNRKMAFFDNI